MYSRMASVVRLALMMSDRAETGTLEAILEGPKSPFGIRFAEPDPTAVKRAANRLRRFASKRIRVDAPTSAVA